MATSIVYLGSGSDSDMLCTMARNRLDFLCLLAIGYDEICRGDLLLLPPNHNKDKLFVKPNLPFALGWEILSTPLFLSLERRL
ncbi:MULTISPECIES: hypothetical protein [Eikenella]|uniref:Uncharacterized protein n=1 Tax=Eikenella exigua TaxID=2528037 RepID=A0AAX1F8H1_9NEIS|nr:MULTISPECIES: hypothetical protein [Eikenella]QED92381.1 hypothetical protein EZJ17_07005 [Eikenella exigua]